MPVREPPRPDEGEAEPATQSPWEREIRALREELEGNYERLRELEKLRDNLVHMIVHDMRSLLGTVMMSGSFLEKKLEDTGDPQSLAAIRALQESANRLKGMITTLLDINRLENHAMPLDRTGCDLRNVVAKASGLMKPPGRNTRLVLDAPEKPMRAYCDPEITQRVVENLLGNALKFTPEGGEVRVMIGEAEEGVRVAVRDEGPGVTEEFRRKIFKKFAQGEAGRGKKHASSGLGLAFCKLAVEEQGGTIGVESEGEQGSTFWFTLPREGTGEEEGRARGQGRGRNHE